MAAVLPASIMGGAPGAHARAATQAQILQVPASDPVFPFKG